MSEIENHVFSCMLETVQNYCFLDLLDSLPTHFLLTKRDQHYLRISTLVYCKNNCAFCFVENHLNEDWVMIYTSDEQFAFELAINYNMFSVKSEDILADYGIDLFSEYRGEDE